MKMGIRWPDTGRKWLCFALVWLVVLLGIWPFIGLFNSETLVFGYPLLLVWSVVILVATTVVMMICNALLGGRR